MNAVDALPTPHDADGFSANPMFYYWGPPTSTLDWCEENYVTSLYIAEFWNTATNICFLFLSVLGICFIRKHQLETRFTICYLGMLLVGIGSCLFHTTLHYEMQLMDELPMIYATSISMYCLFEMNKRAGMDWKLLGLLVLYCTFVTVAYLLTHEPVFHQVAYALQMFIVLGRSVHLVRSIPQGPYRRSLAKLATFSSLTFAGGFVMWNLDNAFCSQLQSARHSVGLPLAAVFQFHGWWHVLTSLGCYGFILLNQAMRLYFLGRHHKFSICYYRGLLPYLHHNLDDKGFL